MPDGKKAAGNNPMKVDKTCRKTLNWCAHAFGSSTAEVDVKDGKMIRIRPLHYDAHGDPGEFNPGDSWRLEARGKVFRPMMKTM
ncbi:hypothetical protein ACFLX3_03680, partial [Chloroflexota bacterium]